MPLGVYKRTKGYLKRLKKQGFQKGISSWNKGKHIGIIPKTAFKKGHISYNKGRKFTKKHIENLSISHKGQHSSLKTEFKKGNPSVFRNKKRPNISGKNHWNWKDGKMINRKYIYIFKPNHPFCDKAGYVREHRLVVECILGRYLTIKEIIHHINEIKNDNRPKNLYLFPNISKHIKYHNKPYPLISNLKCPPLFIK